MWNTPKYIPVTTNESVAYYDSGSVHSDTQAEKPVLLLIHGLGLNAAFWQYAVEYLRSDFRCVAIDLPGHGRSKTLRGDFTMAWYAGILRSFIEQMKFSDVTLCGHSMGGQISMIVSLQMPAIVQRLILVAPAGIEQFTEDERLRMIQGTEFIFRAPIDAAHLIAMHAQQLSMRSELVSELVQEQMEQQRTAFSDFSSMVIASAKGMLNEPVYSFLSGISQPVLILFGGKDQLIPNRILHSAIKPDQLLNDALSVFPRGQGDVLSDCGHFIPFENPHALAQRIIQFYISHSY